MLKTVVEKSLCVRTGLALAVSAASLAVAGFIPLAVTDAQARERDRTLKIQFTHTGEKGEFTFKRNGRYDRAVLNKLNKIMRDWRRNEPTRMDPQLFDLIWEVYQKTGSRGYIHVVSGYRSLKTNNMLRRRSRGVAKRSRHTQGRAMDFFIPGVPVSKIRKIALKMQEGGVGYYPSSRSPFVHLDTGSVRHWPRMSRKQLARVFPNGETVHVPRDGKPLRGYKRALAKLNRSAKNTEVAYLDPRTRSIRVKDDDERKVPVGKWLKKVFAGGVDEEEDNSLSGTGSTPANQPGLPLDLEVAVAGASPVPLPRNVPIKTRMILLAAAERSRVAAADELAIAALVSAPRTPSVGAAATDPANARDDAARVQTASFAGDDNAIAAPDRSALAALYLAAVRRAAELAPGKAPQAKPAVSQASYSLVAAGRQPTPAPAPIRLASYSPVPRPPAVLPKAAPQASAASDVPGSAIAAANALALMGTQDPQPIDLGQKIELAYAAAGATAAPARKSKSWCVSWNRRMLSSPSEQRGSCEYLDTTTSRDETPSHLVVSSVPRSSPRGSEALRPSDRDTSIVDSRHRSHMQTRTAGARESRPHSQSTPPLC